MFEKKNINLSRIAQKGHKIVDDIPFVKKRKRIVAGLKFLKYGFILFLLFLFFALILLLSNIFQLKKTYTYLSNGKDELFQAVEYAKVNNFKQSYVYSEEATKNFRLANSLIDNFLKNKILFFIPVAKNQLTDIKNLVSCVQVLSDATAKVSKIGTQYQAITQGDRTYTELNEMEKHDILKLIYESTPELNGVKANLNLAIFYLEKLHFSGVLKFFETEIKNYEQKLIFFQPLIEKAIPMIQIIPGLMGYPTDATFLVLLQNNDELRPTGGFLGTYGIVQTKNGDIKRFDTHDIYHMDMPVKDKLNVIPPESLKKYLGVSKWYMRDANWSPNWPTSAEQIEWFFHQEDSLLPPNNKINDFVGEFDGVFAISPEFIIELLKFTGPITIDKQTYNAENFMELLQYKVEQGYIQLGVPSWERKEIIGEISKQIKLIIFNKPIKELLQISAITSDSLNKKNILLYFKDKELESISKDFNWTGEIRETQGDYVYVVDANMAALKTDASINRSIKYSIEQDIGGLFAKLNINYAHTGGFDWKTTRYRTYTRIYLPKNSIVSSVAGFSEEGHKVYEEFNKTVIAGFFSLEPGAIGNILISYKLPDYILDSVKEGTYDLLVQKQPGNEVDPLDVRLNFSKEIKEFLPTGFFVNKNKQNLDWKTNLQMDREFSVEF